MSTHAPSPRPALSPIARLRASVMRHRRELVVILAVASFLALMGPNASALTFPLQWLLWVVLIGVGWFVGSNASQIVAQVFDEPPLWVYFAIAPVLCTVAVVPIIVTLELAIGGFRWSHLGDLAFTVWVVSLGVTGVALLASRAFGADAAGQARAAHAAAPATGNQHAETRAPLALRERMPVEVAGGTLYAVSSEDHYLRIYTSTGEALILMRLSDAVRQLSSLEGLRVHRSWWVARAGVHAVERAGGRLSLTLHTGTQVPVSRTYAGLVRESGWA